MNCAFNVNKTPLRRAAKQSFWIARTAQAQAEMERLTLAGYWCGLKSAVINVWNHFTIIPSLCSSHLWFDFWYTQRERPHQNSARAAAGSYRRCNRLQKRFYSRFNSSNVFFTSLTCMPSPTEKTQCFWSNSHHMHFLEDEFETVEVCFDQAFSSLVCQRFLCMCREFVPESCSETAPEKWVFLELLSVTEGWATDLEDVYIWRWAESPHGHV